MGVSRGIQLRQYLSGQLSDQVHDLEKSITTIGRDVNCDIRIQDGKTSRLHCEIILEDGFNVLIDRHSTNGTFVNNARVVHHILEAGDIIQVGNTHFLVEGAASTKTEPVHFDQQSESDIIKSIHVKDAMPRFEQLGAREEFNGESLEEQFFKQSEYFSTHDQEVPADYIPRVSSQRRVLSDSAMEAEGGHHRLAPLEPKPRPKPKEEAPPPAPSAEAQPPVPPEAEQLLPSQSAAPEKAATSIEPHPMEMLQELRVLYAVMDRLNRLNNHEELYDCIGQMIFDVFKKTENFVLAVFHEGQADPDSFHVVRSLHQGNPMAADSIGISRTLVQTAMETQSGILAGNASNDQRFDASESMIRYQIKSVMCAPMISGEHCIGIVVVDNRTEPFCFTEKDLALFTAMTAQFAVTLDKLLMTHRLNRAFHETMLSLINAMEATDSYTRGHTQRVCQYALGIARQIGLNSEQLSDMQTAAMLHDIGKVGIKQGLLNKEGSLSDTEFIRIKDHVEMGCYILEPIAYLRKVIPIIRSHHERWDGQGYPDNLKGEEIPLLGRILAVADSLDAMTTQRSYNDPLSKQMAVRRCREAAGTQFDPKVVDALEEYMRQYDLITTEKTFIGDPSKFLPLKFNWVQEDSAQIERQDDRPVDPKAPSEPSPSMPASLMDLIEAEADEANGREADPAKETIRADAESLDLEDLDHI